MFEKQSFVPKLSLGGTKNNYLRRMYTGCEPVGVGEMNIMGRTVHLRKIFITFRLKFRTMTLRANYKRLIGTNGHGYDFNTC